MIDRDGIERPDKTDAHMREIKHDNSKVKFDGSYNFKPRNFFFKVWAWIFIAVAKPILASFFKLKYKIKYIGKENLKDLRKKAFVMTLNHVFLYDDLSVGTNMFFSRKIYFTGLDRSFRRPFIGFWMRSLGGIPIPASSLSGMKKFNDDVSEILQSGKPVLYNPEGSMWPYYREIRPFKRGAFAMAIKNDVPILPLVLTFKRKKKRNGKFKYRLFFTIGKPLYRDESLDQKAASEKLMKETYEVTVQTAKEFYESQDCGFEK